MYHTRTRPITKTTYSRPWTTPTRSITTLSTVCITTMSTVYYPHHVPHMDQAHHQDYIQQTLDHPHTLHHYTIYGMYIWRVCSWLFVLNISYKEFLTVFSVSITRQEQVSKMLVTEIACIMLCIMFLCCSTVMTSVLVDVAAHHPRTVTRVKTSGSAMMGKCEGDHCKW